MREISLKQYEFKELSSDILSHGGSFSFKAHGSCMYPFICDGDILTVKQVEYSALRVGDIVFYRSSDERLIVHRVVDKKLQSNKLMLLMRGDSVFKNDGWIYSDQVLGKVVSIQRDKKFIQLDQGGLLRLIMYSWNKLYPIGPFSFHLTLKSRRGLSWILRCLQTLKIYRNIVRKLINSKISYHIVTEKDAYKLSRFYGYERLPEIEDPVGLLKNQLQNPNDYGYTFIACKKEKIVGATILTSIPENKTLYPDWWIFGMTVRIRYRGSGIGEGIMRMVMEKAAEEDASRINLLVFEKNKAAMNLYHKMGFRQISIPELDKQLEEEAQREQRRRIIMSRPIMHAFIQLNKK
jgi:ribosomal protein S18 acetylase RimI-like enzyme